MEFEAFYLLYRKYSERTIKALIGDFYQAEDLVQETFLKLYRMRDHLDFSDSKKVQALVCIVSRQKSLDYLRSKAARERMSAEIVESQGSPEYIQKGVEAEILKKERYRNVQNALRKLKEKNRISYEALIRCVYRDESPGKVAEDLEITVNDLYVRISRARHFLKGCFKEE